MLRHPADHFTCAYSSGVVLEIFYTFHISLTKHLARLISETVSHRKGGCTSDVQMFFNTDVLMILNTTSKCC